MSHVIGDPRPAGTEGPAGDQRKAGEEGPAGDTRPAGQETVEAPEETTDTFDPTDHTVDEVKDYLNTADDDEKQRVIDLEKQGKNRTTIVG